MKLRCTREALLSAIQAASAVVPARSTKPVLTNVKLEMSNHGDHSQAVVMATDLEVAIRTEVATVEVSSPGAVLLPSSRLSAIVRESPAGSEFEIRGEGTAAIVKAARSEFRLPAEDPLEFPSVATFPEEACFEISTPLAREIVRRTVFATDNESSRYALGGVLVELSHDRVIAVGTDGRRLAKMEGPAVAQGGSPSAAQPIVPARAMTLIERCLGSQDSPVQLAVHPSEILVRTAGTTISARLVEGRFPRWRDVFPERPEATKVSLVAGPLLAAVRQAAIVTSEQSKGVDFSFEPGVLVLSGKSSESGESRVELPIDHAGPTVRIKIDPRFASDFLRVLDPAAGVLIELTDAQSAAVCRTEDGYGYVIMPLAAD